MLRLDANWFNYTWPLTDKPLKSRNLWMARVKCLFFPLAGKNTKTNSKKWIDFDDRRQIWSDVDLSHTTSSCKNFSSESLAHHLISDIRRYLKIHSWYINCWNTTFWSMVLGSFQLGNWLVGLIGWFIHWLVGWLVDCISIMCIWDRADGAGCSGISSTLDQSTRAGLAGKSSVARSLARKWWREKEE